MTELGTVLLPLRECRACHRLNRAQQRRGMCHACYEKRRRAGQVDSLVSATAAREHVAALRVAGWKYREIARAAGINRDLIAFIVGGRQKIQVKTSVAICAVDPRDRAKFIQHPDPEVVKARVQKAAAALSPEARAERARKAWVTRRANAEKRRRPQRRFEDVVAWERRNAAARRRMAKQREAAAAARSSRAILAALVTPVGNWTREALCAQVDADMFFPEKGGSAREAKAVCMVCPVRAQCLQYALDNGERYGIWGGVTERERRKLTRRQERVA